MTRRSLVAVGSNLPSEARSPAETVREAVAAVAERLGAEVACSRLYRTPAFPLGAGPDYINAAFAVTCELAPEALLTLLHDIEAEFARERRNRWASRTLDLDLLASGDAVRPDAATHTHWRNLKVETQQIETPAQLILPHPRMQDRAFVLVPLKDVAPDWRHPVLGLTIAQMCARLPAEEVESVRPI